MSFGNQDVISLCVEDIGKELKWSRSCFYPNEPLLFYRFFYTSLNPLPSDSSFPSRMKKTSVDQLTKAVGIAKGSFYKFYESKEMAFFAVLESIHSELYGVADHALSEANGLPPSARSR